MSDTLFEKKHNIASFAKEVKGTEHEVYVKLLKMRFKNKVMALKEWHAQITRMKKEAV